MQQQGSLVERLQTLRNKTDRLLLVFTEPEAQDFWLQPGESVEVRASVESLGGNFELDSTREGITVWPSAGMGYISVWADNTQLEVGHQRPTGWA